MVKYKHSQHQQLWIYMSNPDIIMRACERLCEEEGGCISARSLKSYILEHHMGYSVPEDRPIYDCFPCQAAADYMVSLGKSYSFGSASKKRCMYCPLYKMDNCDGVTNFMDNYSMLEKVNALARMLSMAYVDNNVQQFANILVDFCFACQQMAFRPFDGENISLYEVC